MLINLLGIFGNIGQELATSTGAIAGETLYDLKDYIALIVGVMLAVIAVGLLLNAFRK